MNADAIAIKVKGDVLPRLLPAAVRDSIGPGDNLLTHLDSIHLLKMAGRVEAAFGIRIDSGELTPDNIGSIDRLSTFIEGKMKARRMGQ